MTFSDFSFGIICDCQYTDADDDRYDNPRTGFYGDRHYRESMGKLQEAVGVFNEAEVDFVVHLGDLADRDAGDYQAIYSALNELDAPIYQVLGNHDYKAADGSRSRALELLKMQQPYYSFIRHDFRFIVLDSNELSAIDLPRESAERQRMVAKIEAMRQAGHPSAYSWNGQIGPEQLAWLEAQLVEANKLQQKVIALAHHPLFPPGPHNMLNDQKVLEVFKKYPIDAFLNGHNHHGNYGEHLGVPYITFRGMVETSENAFSIAKVNEERIDIKGFGRQENYNIKLRS